MALAVGSVTIEALLDDPGRRAYAAQPEADLLTERDALQEAHVLGIRVDAGESRVAVLFDLRQALQFREGDTAVLVAHGVEKLEWSGAGSQRSHRMAHPVMSSIPGHSHGRVRLVLECLRGARLEVVAASGEFFVGNVPGLPEAPPNLVEDDESKIRAEMQGWSSPFEPEWATFLTASAGRLFPATALRCRRDGAVCRSVMRLSIR